MPPGPWNCDACKLEGWPYWSLTKLSYIVVPFLLPWLAYRPQDATGAVELWSMQTRRVTIALVTLTKFSYNRSYSLCFPGFLDSIHRAFVNQKGKAPLVCQWMRRRCFQEFFFELEERHLWLCFYSDLRVNQIVQINLGDNVLLFLFKKLCTVSQNLFHKTRID